LAPGAAARDRLAEMALLSVAVLVAFAALTIGLALRAFRSATLH